MNKLANEQSAYLKQHSDNPVHWWPYGPEAIAASKEQNKPIFLSIGYSSCHWCHVMAGESFSNEEIAKTLNENFICIKVDREEYPDLDSYYQQACQLFTQSGGWPLSAFLLPDMRPYFVGTYFPPKATTQMTSFPDLLNELMRAYNESHDKVIENAEHVTQTIAAGFLPDQKIEFEGHFPPPMAIAEALKEFRDDEWGGFGQAPKFPQWSYLEWSVEQILEGMITQEEGKHTIETIERILMGGIYDQVRGGLHRYSTDEKWLVPHFEKMLYDQAGMLKTLAKVSLLTPSPLVYDALINTLDYLGKEMLSESGYFFSAQDADSDGMEGLYHTFTIEEFEDVINNAKAADGSSLENHLEDIKDWFGVTSEGNFEQKLNVISLKFDERMELFTQEKWDIIRAAKSALMEARKLRMPPMTDNKGVASWNFMLVSALTDVMQYCQIDIIKNMAKDLFLKTLEGTYQTFLNSPTSDQANIKHTTTKQTSLPYLEDYVSFSELQLRAYEITGNEVFKNNCNDTVQFIIKEFLDGENMLTRAKSSTDSQLYPNQEYLSVDQSHKSLLSTFVWTVRKLAVLNMSTELIETITPVIEKLKQLCLFNPLSSGEALRALTYPDQVYRVIKVPRAWLGEEQYVNFIPYFLPRFSISYTEADDNSWEICSMSECQLNGKGLEDFIKGLTPQEGNA